MGQEFRTAKLSGGPGVSCGCSWDVGRDCNRVKAWLGLEALFPKGFPHVAGKLGLAVGRRPLSLPVKPLHRAAWVYSTRLAPFRAHDLIVSRAEWQCLLCPNFGSDTPALLPRSVSHTCQPWYILGGNLTSAWIPGSEGHWGAILEATIQYSIFFETKVPCYPENNLAFSRSTSFSWATDFVHSAVGWRLSEC